MASLDLGALSYTLKLNRDGFSEGINQTKSDMKGLSDGVKTADEANKVFQSNIKNFQSSLQATGVSFENLDQKLRLWAANNKESIGSVEANSQVIETNKAKMAELASQLSKVETVLRETKTIFGENSTEYKKVENSVIELEISYGKLEEENKRLIASNKEMEASANPSFFEKLKTNVSSVGEATERLGSKGISVSGILGKAFGSIKSVVMNTAVPIMAGMGLQSLIDKSKAGQQAVGQMNAVLASTHGVAGMTKDALLNLAQSQSQVTTYSKGANIATENLLLTFTNIGKDVFPSALKAVNDMSTALGQDTKSSAIQLGKALNDPISGITALSRVGVNFTDQQKQQIKTMVETGHAAEAQKAIVAELNKEFGGSAVAAGKTFDGQLTIIKNQLFGIGAGITSQLIPPVTSFLTMLNSHMPQIQSTVNSVISGVSTSFKTLGPILLGIGQDVGKIATEVFPQMDSSGSNLGKTILSLTKGALTDLKGVFDWLAQHGNVTRAAILGIGTAFAALKTASTVTNIFKAFTDGAAGVKTATGLVSNFGKAFSTLTKLPVTLASGFGSLGTKAVSSIGLFSSGLGTLGSKLSALMVGPWKLLINGFKSLPGIIKNLSFTNIVTKLINPFKNMPTLLRGIFSKIPGTFGTFKTALTGLASSVVSLGPKILSGIKSAFSIQGIMNGAKAALALFTSPWGALVLVIVAAVGAIIANWDSIKAWVTQHFGGTLPTSFKQFQQIFSQIWTTIQQVFAQVWNNIKNVVTQVWAYISPTIMGAVKQIQAFWNEVWPELKELFVEVWNVMKVVLAPAVAALYTIISTGIGLIKGIWGPAWNVLKDTLKTVWDAITGVIKVAWDIVSGVIKVGLDLLTGHWSKAWDDFKSIFSNTWNDLGKLISNIAKDALKWGSDIIDGIVKGIEGAAGGLKNSVGNVANTIRSYLHFSVPDEGPLTDYETWMPDFMQGLADGIDGSLNVLDNSLLKVSDALANAVVPERSMRDQLWIDMDKGIETYDSAIQKLSHANDMLAISTGNAQTDLRNMLGQMTNISTMSVAAYNQYHKLGNSIGWTNEKTQAALKSYQDYQKAYAETAQKVVDAEQKIRDNQYDTALEKIDAKVKILTSDTDDLYKKLDGQQQALEELQFKAAGLDTQYQELVKTYGEFSDEAKNAAKAIDENNQAIQDMNKSIEETQQKMEDTSVSDLNNLFDKLKSALKDYYDEQEKQEEASWQAKIDNNSRWKEDTLSNLESVYNAKKSEIEREKTLLDRSDSDEDDNDKIAEDKKILSMNYSAAKKAEAQKDLNDTIKDMNRRHQKESLDDQESALETQYNNDKDNIEKVAQQNEDYYNSQIDSIKAFYEDKEKAANLDAEAQQMIVQNNQTEIVKLLKSYGEDYEIAGASLGERLVKGFKDKMFSIGEILDGVTLQANDIVNKIASTPSVAVNAAYSGGYSNGNYSSGRDYMQQTTVHNSYGALLHADKIVLNNSKDVQQTAEELEFYRQQAARSRGGK